jgi:outer membrane protein TolC
VGFAATFTQTQAIAYALEHHPDLATGRKESELARDRIDLARTGRMPSVGISLSAKYANNPMDAFVDPLLAGDVTQQDFDPANLNDPDNSHLLAGELSLRMPLYDWGRVDAQINSASSEHVVSEAMQEQRSELVAYRAWQSYQAVINAIRSISVIEDAIKAAQQHANTTAELVRAGRIVESDQLTAELNLTGLQAMRAQATHRLNHAKSQLKWSMGLEQATSIEVVDVEKPMPAVLNTPIKEQVQRALSHRRDLEVIHKQAESYRANSIWFRKRRNRALI